MKDIPFWKTWVLDNHICEKECSGTKFHTSSTDDVNETVANDTWIVVATPNRTYDLLTLQNGITTLLGETNIPSGTYTQMRLVLGTEPDDARHPYANYIVFLDGGAPEELNVPSNVFRTNHNFAVNASQSYTMVIDFDANQSIHQAGNSGRWILNPVISIETTIDEPEEE